MKSKDLQSQTHKDLTRRYLLWFYKTTKESFERIERKTTQLKVDEYVLKQLKTSGSDASLIKEFETYITTKEGDELKLKFADKKGKTLHPQYVYLKNKLQAIEAAIIYFLGKKELKTIQSLYEKEFTIRILQAREH